MEHKSEILIQSELTRIVQIRNFINSSATCFDLWRKLLEPLKPSGFFKNKQSSDNIERLEISIPAKLSSVIEVEAFTDSLYEYLYSRGLLFYRIKVAVLDAVNYIIWANRRRDRNIKVAFVKMEKQIEVTISCASKNKKHYALRTPLPCNEYDLEDRGAYLYLVKRYPDKISFSNEGTEIILSFRSSAKAKKNKKIIF